MTSQNLIEIKGLNKSYTSGSERLHVLKDLDLEVHRAELIAVTGVSGSGKSTLLHIIGGMDRPDSGQVLWDSQDLATLSKLELASFRNREVGFVFQFHHLLPEFTALENAAFPLLLRRADRAGAFDQARSVLREVNLDHRLDHKPGELSGGEQQRVAIARAVVGSPRLVLADEPTGNLDPATARSVHALLRDLQKQKSLTVIIVTHNEQLAGLCDVVKRMEGGRLV